MKPSTKKLVVTAVGALLLAVVGCVAAAALIWGRSGSDKDGASEEPAATILVTVNECSNGACNVDVSGLLDEFDGYDDDNFNSNSTNTTTTIQFQLTEGGTALHCVGATRRNSYSGNSWHGACSGGGSATLLKTGGTQDSQERELVGGTSRDDSFMHGSIVDLGQDLVCRIFPNVDGVHRAVCTPSSDFAPEGDPIEDEDEEDPEGEEAEGGTAVGEATVDFPGNRNRNLVLIPPGGDNQSQDVECGGKDDSGKYTLDILMAWTVAAECGVSELPSNCRPTIATERSMRAHIDIAILESNDAFVNSGIHVQLRLVHGYRVDYQEGPKIGAFDRALKAIWRPSDGLMDEIHDNKREQVRQVITGSV